ncbi:MAG: rhomboid family intramembrane serine protease [Betaproteobacteria bacterium]|nr:rhomboid family intramembrane serine protease [Betaproteobacteria bacterium]
MLVYNDGIENEHSPLANWLVAAATVGASYWAWQQPELLWDGLAKTAPWGAENLLIAPFFHLDWEHLFWNMYFLLCFGNSIAGGMAAWRYLEFYMFLIAASSIGSALFLGGLSIGASGAIYGLMGFFIVAFGRVNLQLWLPPAFVLPLPSWLFIAFRVGADIWAVWAGRGGATDYWAHLAGFLAGVSWAALLKKRGLM